MVPSPRVLGFDAFVLRRGLTYGTLLVDLEHRRPVAVLEGRTAEPFTVWLQAHPTVAILVRDRAGAYAVAGRRGAPDALQVAERPHLVRHVSEARKALRHSRQWHQLMPATAPTESRPLASETQAGSAELPRTGRQLTPRKHAVWGLSASGAVWDKPAARSLGPWGWIAGRCAGTWPLTSRRSIRCVVLGRPG